MSTSSLAQQKRVRFDPEVQFISPPSTIQSSTSSQASKTQDTNSRAYAEGTIVAKKPEFESLTSRIYVHQEGHSKLRTWSVRILSTALVLPVVLALIADLGRKAAFHYGLIDGKSFSLIDKATGALKYIADKIKGLFFSKASDKKTEEPISLITPPKEDEIEEAPLKKIEEPVKVEKPNLQQVFQEMLATKGLKKAIESAKKSAKDSLGDSLDIEISSLAHLKGTKLETLVKAAARDVIQNCKDKIEAEAQAAKFGAELIKLKLLSGDQESAFSQAVLKEVPDLLKKERESSLSPSLMSRVSTWPQGFYDSALKLFENME